MVVGTRARSSTHRWTLLLASVFLSLTACDEAGDSAGTCPDLGCGVARRSVVLEPGLGEGTYVMSLAFDLPGVITEQCELTIGPVVPATGDASAATEVTTTCQEFAFNLGDDGLVSKIVIASGVENANDPFERASLTLWEDGVKTFGDVGFFEALDVPLDASQPQCGTCERFRATFQL